MSTTDISSVLGKEAEFLLSFNNPRIPKEQLHLPHKKFLDTVFAESDRSFGVLHNLKSLRDHGRLRGTGYYSILPVDQDIEHTTSSSFTPNPLYFDPANIVRLAIEGGCNAIASSYGTLAIVSKRFADHIPFIVKLNHNDLFRYPNTYDQRMFATVDQAYNLGAKGVGATVYFGSSESIRQMEEVRDAFAAAHERGLFTVLWCYVRNDAFKTKTKDFQTAADFTGQANHIGVSLGADIIKQKMPTTNGGYTALNKKGHFGKYDTQMYDALMSEHPIDLCRYQVANCYMGRVGMINSGGEHTTNDMQEAVRLAVVNKRAGGSGLIMGRKAFQRPMEEGIALLHAVQDVYLSKEVTIA